MAFSKMIPAALAIALLISSAGLAAGGTDNYAENPDVSVGRAALVQGRYADAARYLEMGSRHFPSSARVWRELGLARLLAYMDSREGLEPPVRSVDIDPQLRGGPTPAGDPAGFLAGALDALEHSAGLDPTSAATFTRIAAVRAEMGETDGARAVLEHALTLDPNSSDALNDIGVLEFHAGDLASAEKQFEMAIKASPVPNHRFEFNLAFVRTQRQPGERERLMRDYVARTDRRSGYAEWIWNQILKSAPPMNIGESGVSPQTGLAGVDLGIRVDYALSYVGWTEDSGSTTDGAWDWYKFDPQGVTLFVDQSGINQGEVWTVLTFVPNSDATPEGISLGSDGDAVYAAYGNPEQTRSWNDEWLLEYPSQGITFRMLDGAVKGIEVFQAR